MLPARGREGLGSASGAIVRIPTPAAAGRTVSNGVGHPKARLRLVLEYVVDRIRCARRACGGAKVGAAPVDPSAVRRVRSSPETAIEPGSRASMGGEFDGIE